jgi:hypothetical protein
MKLYYEELKSLLFTIPYLEMEEHKINRIKTYAIVQCSASKSIYNYMEFYEPKMKSLYSEKYNKKLFTIAPLLVDLNELEEVNDDFLPFLLGEARKENAVVFFHSYFEFDELHTYFQKMTMASTPVAETLYEDNVEYEQNISFFYTAKSLPNHIRSSVISGEKFREYFSPILAYIVPKVDNLEVINLYMAIKDYTELMSSTYNLNEEVSIIKDVSSMEYLEIPNHIYITPQQIEVFDEIATEKFIDKFLVELKEDGYKFSYDDKELRYRADEAVKIVDELKLKTDGETAHFILINLYLPNDFLLQKQMKFLSKLKESESYGERIELLKKMLAEVKRKYFNRNNNAR